MMQLGMIQEQLKNFAAARDAYENLLSVVYSAQLGQLDKAYDLAQKAREAVPNEPSIADTLGWIMFKKGDYGNALRLLQESAGKLPTCPKFSSISGWRITCWARNKLPALRCKRLLMQQRIFRKRMKRGSD